MSCGADSVHHIESMWLRYAVPVVGILVLVIALAGGKHQLVAAREEAGYRLMFIDCAAGLRRGCSQVHWVCVVGECEPLPMPQPARSET